MDNSSAFVYNLDLKQLHIEVCRRMCTPMVCFSSHSDNCCCCCHRCWYCCWLCCWLCVDNRYWHCCWHCCNPCNGCYCCCFFVNRNSIISCAGLVGKISGQWYKKFDHTPLYRVPFLCTTYIHIWVEINHCLPAYLLSTHVRVLYRFFFFLLLPFFGNGASFSHIG